MTVTTPARVSLKVAGASGQGVNSAGPMLARGLKRAGYCVFGYREYPSLIQGGHSTYQLDVSAERLRSSEISVDLMVAFDHHGLELDVEDIKDGGVLLHVTPEWTFPKEQHKVIDDRGIRVVAYPVYDALHRLGAKPVMANVLLCSIAWSMLGQDHDALKSLASERFGNKPDLLDLNVKCIDEGRRFVQDKLSGVSIALPDRNPVFCDQLLLTGSDAMGLGAIHGGVRFFASYPMTPASYLTTFLSSHAKETHMVVKQAEDEITAAQLASGAMWMGTRALVATAGVGFDLMTETMSMNAMMENPFVVVLGQRPGPATGLATWTAQSGLLTAVGGGHGEFVRCVLAPSNSQDSFDLMPQAFNLAEKYQIPVVVLTDKQIAEALYTQPIFELGGAEVTRNLVCDPDRLDALVAADRYDPSAADGVSARWLPGTHAATYCAQADEHDPTGSVAESSRNTTAQVQKRMRKLEHLKAELAAPRLHFSGGQQLTDVESAQKRLDLLVIGWGSTGDVMLDVLEAPQLRALHVAYLHYTYLWPLRTDELMALVAGEHRSDEGARSGARRQPAGEHRSDEGARSGARRQLASRAVRVVSVEQNFQGQLGMLISMECGLQISDRILKYDGRPFFYDELLAQIMEHAGISTEDGAIQRQLTHGRPAGVKS